MMFLKFIFIVGVIVVGVSIGNADDEFLKKLLDESALKFKNIDSIKAQMRDGIKIEEFDEKGYFNEKKDFSLGHDETYSSLHHLEGGKISSDKSKLLTKIVATAFEEELKKDELTDSDLEALTMYLAKLMESKSDNLFLKKEDLSKGPIVVEELLKKATLEPGEYFLKEDPLHDKHENKDVKTYLAEGFDQFKIANDEDKALFKAITEMKTAFAMEPHEKHPLKDEYFKTYSLTDKAPVEDGHLKDEEIFKKILEELKGATLNKEGVFFKGKEFKIPHTLLTAGKEHGVPEEKVSTFYIPKVHTDEDILKEHTSHQEEAIKHKKDFIFDEILSHEEAHAYDEDFDAEKSGVKKGILHKSEELDKAGLEEFLSKEDFVSGELLKGINADKAFKDKEAKVTAKGEGSLSASGTPAYEKAREQAFKDANIPLADEEKKHFHGDEALKKTIIDHSEAGKYHPDSLHKDETLNTEVTIKKDKALLDGKEDVRKVLQGRDIDSASATDEKFIFEIKKKEEGATKETGHDVKAEEEHFKYGIKSEEGHFAHGIRSEEEHFAHGIQSDEGYFKHGTETKRHIAEGEEIHKILQTDAEKSHHKALALKNKLISFLSRIAQMKCHLVSMRPGELLSIVNCVSRSKDPLLCEKFSLCEKKKPLRVIYALEKCQKELIPEQLLRCSKYEPLFPSPEIPLKIFQCVAKNIRELSPEEKKQMINFEECARQVKAESCGRIPWG